jgi:hypothetical protein
MAQDTSGSIDYFLLIDKAYLDHLSVIRQWPNLKVAFDSNQVWITNFNSVQIESVEVKSIPYKQLFYSTKNKLYMLDSLLPDRNVPTFLWTPIERALPISIETYNHNYFGIKQTGPIQLVKTDETEKESVMLTTLDKLVNYIETAPNFRVNPIEWVLLNTEDVLLFGTPILPINGAMYWVNKDSILPVGYNFELSILAELIGHKLNIEKDDWLIWNTDSTYFKVNKDAIKPLSLSSVRKTVSTLNSSLENA